MDNWLSPALREPTQEALEIMRLSLVDWLACGLAGVDEPVAQLTRAMVLDESGAEQSSLFGGGKAPARAAALVNGATSHALDYDDTHFAHIGHPSVAVNSAVLAVAEREGADFDAFLRACLAGCEASIRFGVLLGRDHYQIGFHQTATAGAFGATVAAGLLLGLSDEQMRHALGLVSTRASGLKSQFGTMGKPYNAGIAAANGVEAADLARRGFVSNPEALFGQNGFVTTHHGRGVEASTDDWLMEQISHKFHACCHGLHATLEALTMLDPGPGKDIQKIEITTHPRWMTVCNQQSPQTGLEAKFSYRAVTALALLGHDTASLDSYRDELMQDPEVLALMDKVAVTSEPSLAETEARVVVTGQGVASATFDLNTPLSLQTRSDKIRAKAQVLTGDDQVWQAVQVQDLPNIVGLFR
ncbi:MmgE/PrpD family protein [Tropicibacter sp. R15_0]|uniref:MmgE/PrpD family protein n=1 Tax=Tropicibacter sp. R15_0 TaxID=2821101 RepID=UPI001ADC7D7A|nr:MmgE/PrpD family protein [Tropicibacter sp. R15_0]MBO9466783.1 MmgE/PrpD family protein [Tropicibacter sp. R15_0]